MKRRCMSDRDHWRLLMLWLAGMTLVMVRQVVWSRIGQPTLLNSGDQVACVSPPPPDHDEVEVLVEGPLDAGDRRLIHWVQEGAGGRVVQPSAAPYNTPDTSSVFWRETEVWKFYVRYVKKYFEHKVGGFFVEAGALDGYVLSTTLRLERDQEWTGLLVEPRPDMFHQLLDKHRKAHAARFCLSEKPYPHSTSFWMSPDYVKESVAFSAVGSQLLEKVKGQVRETGSVVKVLCLPLATLLRALGRTHVDLWVLDVEGVEWGVLDLFPFNEITVDVLMVERKDKGEEDRRAFVSLVQSKGFTMVARFKEDFVFVRNNSNLELGAILITDK
ncbi:protein Star-like [Scylla paramamosain]|uniref:protein Star-like n=1 Tax=Scylla paramamosain TaxID=85552 RepID=UPI003083CDF6